MTAMAPSFSHLLFASLSLSDPRWEELRGEEMKVKKGVQRQCHNEQHPLTAASSKH